LRVGVVVLVPEPIATEVHGLRRACGDPALDRVSPHVTLVPPVNVSEVRLGEALGRVRRAASIVGPFVLRLGPAATFAPDSPTLYLAVDGDDLALSSLARLRDEVFQPPLHRPLAWPFVPHVTLADETDAERLAAGVRALADFRVEMPCTAVHLLHEVRQPTGPRWVPLADARFGDPIVVGRGGLPLELWVSGHVDPEAGALLESERLPRPDQATTALVVTARRRDGLVGVLWGDAADVRAAAVVASHRGEGIARHLEARFVAESDPPA
jgi:2'-5' RNA ligase